METSAPPAALTRFSGDGHGAQKFSLGLDQIKPEAKTDLRPKRNPWAVVSWLHDSSDPQHGLVIPFAGFVANAEGKAQWELKLRQPYSPKDLLEKLQKAAENRRAEQDKWYPQDAG